MSRSGLDEAVSDRSRLFCVGRNYADHAREMGAQRPDQPIIFLKPATSRVSPGRVRLPGELGRVDFEGELVLLLSGDPARPLAGLALGVDLTLREQQSRLKSAGLPWDVSKGFDKSAWLGPIIPWPSSLDRELTGLSFETRINGEQRQLGRAENMLFSPEELLATISQFWVIRRGDLLFTGTPAGVGPLSHQDVLEMSLLQPASPDASAHWQLELG